MATFVQIKNICSCLDDKVIVHVLVFHDKCEFHTNRELQLMLALNEKPGVLSQLFHRGATHQLHSIVTYTNI